MSPRPGRIHSTIDIDLGERTDAIRNDAKFFEKTNEVRSALRSVEQVAP